MLVVIMDFKSVLKDKARLKKIMEGAFHSVDLNGSGYLDESELKQVLIQVAKDIGVDMPSREEVSEILEEFDENGDGKLSREEF
jgi:Ca2+-binding EF-hand superfamily protein